MPTREDLNELRTKCSYSRIIMNGVNGGLFTGPNGNSIFFPAAGNRYNTDVYAANESGFYASSTLHGGDSRYAYALIIPAVAPNCVIDGYTRIRGISIRAVIE